jgi:hypothetical protein
MSAADDDPVEFVKASRSRGGTSAASCAVSVVNRGRAVTVYPSAEVDAHTREWRGVEVEFGRGTASGKFKSVKLTRADEGGLKIRRYDQQHAKVNVTAPAGTVARSSNGNGKQTCDGVVEEDGSVVITLPPTVTFEPTA